jgi:hypothetical protein
MSANTEAKKTAKAAILPFANQYVRFPPVNSKGRPGPCGPMLNVVIP